mmetsp:Transcript_47229/g.69966  ORF Transcript_47229/g.69966 Transcript_47229/m.69966 type:complete len:80 (+) Transcript_47229:100-339(+)
MYWWKLFCQCLIQRCIRWNKNNILTEATYNTFDSHFSGDLTADWCGEKSILGSMSTIQFDRLQFGIFPTNTPSQKKGTY